MNELITLTKTELNEMLDRHGELVGAQRYRIGKIDGRNEVLQEQFDAALASLKEHHLELSELLKINHVCDCGRELCESDAAAKDQGWRGDVCPKCLPENQPYFQANVRPTNNVPSATGNIRF